MNETELTEPLIVMTEKRNYKMEGGPLLDWLQPGLGISFIKKKPLNEDNCLFEETSSFTESSLKIKQ